MMGFRTIRILIGWFGATAALLSPLAAATDFEKFCRSVLQYPEAAFGQMFGKVALGPFMLQPLDSDQLLRIMFRTAGGDSFNKSAFSTEAGNLSLQATFRHGLFQVTVQTSHQAIEDHIQLVFWDFIRKGHHFQMPDGFKGIVFQTQTNAKKPTTYFFLNLAAGPLPETAPAAYRNLVSDYRNQVFSTYYERLKISEADAAKLREASEKTESRTLLMVKTHSPIVNYPELNPALPLYTGVNPAILPRAQHSFYTELPEHFEIESGVSLVYSFSPDELLPFELISKMRAPRVEGELASEPGRLVIKKNKVVEASVTDWAQISAMFAAGPRTQLYIQADGVHQRLFSQMGFRPIGVNGEYAGTPYSIMKMSSREFLKHHSMAVFQSGVFQASSAWMADHWGKLSELLPGFRTPGVMERIQELDRELTDGVFKVR